MLRQLILRGASETLNRCQVYHCQASLSTCHPLSTGTRGNDDVWENVYQQQVPRTMEEMNKILHQELVSPPNPHLLKLAVVGMPNCGKSTLINKLMGWKVCSASCKVHTTQVNARAVYNVGSSQLVFLDTPGLVTPQEVTKYKLKRSLLTDPELSLHEADLLAVVHDVSTSAHFSCNLDSRLVRLLALNPTIPAVLVLNKVDLLKSKANLLHITQTLTEGVVGGQRFMATTKKVSEVNKKKLLKRASEQNILSSSCDPASSQSGIHDNNNANTASGSESPEADVQNAEVEQGTNSLLNTSYNIDHIRESDILAGKVRLTEQQVQTFIQDRNSWPLFKDVFMISAKDGSGVDDFRDYLLTCAKPRPWIFSPQVATDQNPEEIILMTVREKFLDYFKKEIPYTLKFSIEHWDVTETDLLGISINVKCGKKGLVRVLLGSRGSIIARMAREAEQELRNTFRSEVKLRLTVAYDPHMKKRMANR